MATIGVVGKQSNQEGGMTKQRRARIITLTLAGVLVAGLSWTADFPDLSA